MADIFQLSPHPAGTGDAQPNGVAAVLSRLMFLGVVALAIAGLRELAFWWNDRHRSF